MNPPAHLRQPGRETIGFSVVIHDGNIEIGGPLNRADALILLDYEVMAEIWIKYNVRENVWAKTTL